MKTTSLTKNIRFIYIYIFVAQLFFDRALWVIYLNDKGLSMSEIGIVEALMHLSVVLLEIPTGIIADVYGRKVSLFIGNILSVGYGTFMLVGDSLSLFGLALMTLGTSITFQSGAEEALIYDTLKEKGKEKQYTRVFGNMTALALLSLSFAKLAGGWMAEINWELVYGGIIITHLLALIPIAMLHEPEREKNSSSHTGIKQQWINQLKSGIRIWRTNQPAHIPIIFFIMIGTSIVILTFYGQEYFTRLGYGSMTIGIIFTVEGLLGVLMAKLAYRLESKWSFVSITNYGYLLYLVFFLLFTLSPDWAIVLSFLILSQLVTLYEPIFSNFIQGGLESSVRATFFSMISVVESFIIMLLFPLFGLMIDTIGFRNGFLGLFVMLGVLYIAGVRRIVR
ncbi:Major Facilitator Superfamily protein [Virgibacillus subterraneus]|uniref:Major Facilitator Superfamily protein n=2 Tax=Virgibacillus TaxID=84406 RepID=A0A1H1EQZ0_9BACI|nr:MULTISPECIES: MFS transporter [Virgibacillus]SDQ90536.1 Major Facilitator Superfamily protein [Virgibacillus salinus]SEQ46804.1 Major Facilitator Superfamily protein [Virgibacillus subterraneus]